MEEFVHGDEIFASSFATAAYLQSIDFPKDKKVWDRIAPGLASHFDSPYTIPAIAPRPLLTLNGSDDHRCPLDDLETPKLKAQKAYEAHHHDGDGTLPPSLYSLKETKSQNAETLF